MRLSARSRGFTLIELLVVIAIFMLAGPFMFSTVTGFFQTIFTEIGRVGR